MNAATGLAGRTLPEPSLVCIGGSAGSLKPLQDLVRCLPAHFPVPVVVCVHRGNPVGIATTPLLVKVLREAGHLPVHEIEDLDELRPGVHVAPPGYHTLVGVDGLMLSAELPENYSTPSIDVLFDSASAAYGPGVVAVILSCANSDGVAACERIRADGGTILAQSPSTAEHDNLIAAVCERVGVDELLSGKEIGEFLCEIACIAGAEVNDE